MDRRDMSHQWYEHFDPRAMQLVVEVPHGGRPGVAGCSCFAVEPDETQPACEACRQAGYTELFIGGLVVPAKYDVCGTCDGHGKHVNPSIDAHGLSREDFDDDPDFAEDYFSGVYDVPCAECGGRSVVPIPDTDRMTAAEIQAVNDTIEGYYREAAEREHERRMGY